MNKVNLTYARIPQVSNNPLQKAQALRTGEEFRYFPHR